VLVALGLRGQLDGGRRVLRTPTRTPDIRPVDDTDPVSCLDCGEPLRTGPDGERYCSFDGTVWAAGTRRVGLVGTTHN